MTNAITTAITRSPPIAPRAVYTPSLVDHTLTIFLFNLSNLTCSFDISITPSALISQLTTG